MAKPDLYRETKAAETLRENLCALFEGDNQLAVDSIEGETNLIEAMELAIKAVGEDRAAVEALEIYIRDLTARKDRLKQRIEMTRTAMEAAFAQAGRQTLETPYGTAHLSKTPDKLDIFAEYDIPLTFFRTQPKLDRKAVKAALMEGTPVPGARLNEGGQSVVIRHK